MNFAEIKANVQKVSAEFGADRRTRQKRRELVREDFDDLISAGFHLTGVLAEQGGLWESPPKSTRKICELLRTLAHGDSSVALVSSMHPCVLAFWLTTPTVPEPANAAWQEQRNACSRLALDGNLWGTITSEPGSGGDVLNTKTRASRHNGSYRVSGLKHFGSGTGIKSFMITTAVPEGESEPDVFYLDMRDIPLDGSHGAKMMFPWDGHGMIATQSHSVQFEDFPATRMAWTGHMLELGQSTNSFVTCCFASVIVGIVEVAHETARESLASRQASLKAYEQVEWTSIQIETWLIQQALEGMLKAVEEDSASALHDTLLGKTAIAELAEKIMGRICRVMGGGTFSRHSPFGFWFEDVRALGFLRPPWVLAYEQLFQGGWLP
jgi:alkylation response protein AidB-like acyl-CoA dehydrogenase